MNTNPNAKRILCFGDSNTWGFIPASDYERYSVKERWTGILQDILSDDYEIIEEGLNGRTTTRDSIKKEGKNGLKYLLPCLETHKPLDLVILALGTNDLKTRYSASAEDIANGIRELIKVIKVEGKDNSGKTPEILLISPATIEEYKDDVKGGKEKSRQLGRLYKQIATEYDLLFLDLSTIVKASEKDGIHLDSAAHRVIAEEVMKIVQQS